MLLDWPQALRRGGFRRAMKEDIVLSADIIAAQQVAQRASAPTPQGESLLELVLSVLDENKAEDVISIDLRGKSSMGDAMVIASGRSSRQVGALAEHITDAVKSNYGISAKVEGKDLGDWVLIDTGDVIVHLFRPEVREFYQIEKMWLDPADASAR